MASPEGSSVVLSLVLALLAPVGAARQGTTAPPVDAEPASPRPADAESFEKEYESATKATRERRWKEARAAWTELLSRHAKAPYVRARLVEIREQVKKCSFWQSAREPQARDLVSGELLSYEPGSGRIRIRYTPADLADFGGSELGAVAVHPMRFVGPWSVEIKGKAAGLTTPSFYVGLEDGVGHGVMFGARISEYLMTLHQLL